MKKFDSTIRVYKKIPLDIEEHKELANDLLKAQRILEPWVARFYKAFPVNGRERRELRTVLNLLSSKLCDSLDERWYEIRDGSSEHKSPYYGNGKTAW